MKKSIILLATLCLAYTANAQTGVVIDGIKWAETNVGEPGVFVGEPQEFGNYYDFWEAQSACPAGWRVPTQEEIKSLTTSGSRWTEKGGVQGVEFGSGENTIFIPAAGRERTRRRGDDLYVGTHCFYWTSTSFGRRVAHNLLWYRDFSANPPYGGATLRSNGSSVRCVEG
jgi:uncharacterized protein (TIGR02145 family)